jgi:hypothetical protein
MRGTGGLFVALALSIVLTAENAVANEAAAAPHDDAYWIAWVPDPATLAVPDVGFAETAAIADDYDNYFYFRRPDTSFAQALSDIRECDLRARRLWRTPDPESVTSEAERREDGMVNSYFATLTGPLMGGLVAGLAGPGEERQTRRFGLRRCMFYKGYGRFGLPEDLWRQFNFDATERGLSEQQRQEMLAKQALLASTGTPRTQELGL